MANQDTQVKLTAVIDATSKGLVDALKQASSAVNSSTDDWKSKFASLKDSTNLIGASVKNLSDLIGKVGDVNMDVRGMEQINGAIQSVTTNFEQVKGEIDSFVAKLSEMKQEASSLSMPLEDYQRFAEAVKASGVSMEESKGMLQAMQQQIQAFANGVPEAQRLFDKLGITLEQVSSNSVSANFEEIVRAINETIPASERATQNMQMFKAAIDKTLAVSEQYNKAISKQSGTYASDKDLQNAISMQNVLYKLGEQVSGYTDKMKEAGEVGGSAGERITMWLKMQREEFAIVSAEIDRYINSIDEMSKSLNGATSAIGVLKNRTEEFKNTTHATDETKAQVKDLYDMFSSLSGKIQTEYDKIKAIINNQLKLGGKVDTTSLDEAKQHILGLLQAWNNLNAAQKSMQLSISAESMKSFVDFGNKLNEFKSGLDGLGVMADNRNIPLAIDEIAKSVDALVNSFTLAKQNMQKGIRVKFDTKEIDNVDKALTSLMEKASKVLGWGQSTDRIKQLQQDVGNLTGEVQRYNAEVAKGVPIWQPITNAVNKVRSAVNGVTSSVKASSFSWKGIGESIRNCWSYMTHFKATTDEAGNSGKSLGQILRQAGGQILGMGTAVAVITKAWQQLNKLAKEYLDTLYEAEKVRMYGSQGEGADDMTKVRTKKDTTQEEMTKKLVEFANLYDEERRNGSQEAHAKRVNLQSELKKQYGFEFKEVRGAILNLDTQVTKKLNELTKSRIEAIDAQIEANNKVREGVDAYIENFGYWHQVGSTYTGDVNGKGRINEAQERSNRAAEENRALMEERRKLEREELSAQYRRLRTGKHNDEANKRIEEERKRAQKAQEDSDKARREGNKKLADWYNGLTDNDHQKALREIMTKYEDLVKAGVNEQAARNTAIIEITKLLNKEAEDEKKKNEELVKTLDERIKAYKDAYQAYLDAEKQVVNAKKEYARTQKDLSTDARRERMQRRQDRVRQKMGRFGFSSNNRIKLNESESARRKRLKRQELDAGISEKMQQYEKGERVHWTPAEKKRIKEYNRLERKDRAYDAAMKQMDAAKKQEEAADRLKNAASAIQDAFMGRYNARGELNRAGREARQASGNRRTWSRNYTPGQVFDQAKRRGLNAPGVKGAAMQGNYNYTQQFGQLHKDLQGLSRRVYIVR